MRTLYLIVVSWHISSSLCKLMPGYRDKQPGRYNIAYQEMSKKHVKYLLNILSVFVFFFELKVWNEEAWKLYVLP